jgi:hypothetical protein
MIIDANFPWSKTYLAAFSETDPTPLSLRISEAMSALTQRQLSPLSNKEEKDSFASSSDSDAPHADPK